jgi:hypothetical protein
VVLLQAVAQFAHDRLEVRLGGSGADDKKIRKARNAAEIDGYDLLGFFFGDEFGADAGE